MHRAETSDQSRVALITGAAGALGSVVARRFTEAGWTTALLARAEHRSALSASFPGAVTVSADLLEPVDTGRAIQDVLARTGRIDALLHMVGGFGMQSVLDLDRDGLERQLDVNLRTCIHATQAVLPTMLERGSGTVVGMAARAAVRAGARMPAYAASKAALMGYLDSLRAEVGGRGLAVSVLVPMGTIDTVANRNAMPDSDPERWIDPEELAGAALFLAERGPRGRVPLLEVYPPA